MSPVLFAAFNNDVIVKLEVSGPGCFIHDVCFNTLMYTDDVSLLSISVTHLQKMLYICVEELASFDMKINDKNLNWLRIGGIHNTNVTEIYVYGVALERVDQFIYFAVTILAGWSFRCDLHSVKITSFRSLNGILSKVGTASPSKLTLFIIYIFCTPSLLFGLEALQLTKSQITSLSYP